MLRRAAKSIGLGPPVRWGRAQWAAHRPKQDWEIRGRVDDERTLLLLRCSLAADANCIDVGASSGGLLAEMTRLAPRGRHIAYEPLPEYCELLRSRFPDVETRCAALSNVAGQTEFVRVRNGPAFSGMKRRYYPFSAELETIVVPTETLDSHLPEDYVPSLIKIDVEGAEHLVLEGALETIRRHQPMLILEHGRGTSSEYGQDHTREIYDMLCEHAGLRIFDLDGRGPYSLSDFESTPRWNFVAHR